MNLLFRLCLGLFLSFRRRFLNILSEVRIDGVLEVFYSRLVMERDDVAVVHKDVETVPFRKTVEFILEVLRVGNIFFQTKNGPFREVNRLTHYRTKHIAVVKGLNCSHLISYVNRRLLKNFSFNFIRLKSNVKVPFSYFLGFGNHLVQFFDALDSVLRFLKETLTNVCHDSFVLSNFRRYTNKDAQLWREENVLPFLFYFKKRLIKLVNFGLISFKEILKHRNFLVIITLVEEIVLGRHVPPYSVDLVCPFLTIICHYYGSFELTVDFSLISPLESFLNY